MGRKIKGKKHHGVKDPEKQKEVREAKIRTKINNRPSAEDFQEIPKSLKDTNAFVLLDLIVFSIAARS